MNKNMSMNHDVKLPPIKILVDQMKFTYLVEGYTKINIQCDVFYS